LRVGLLGQQVQRTARKDKRTLVLAKSVVNGNQEGLASLVLGDTQLDLTLATGLQGVIEADGVDLVAGVNPVVIFAVGKSQRHDTLLFQVGLVDTSEALGDNDAAAEVTGLQGGMLTGRALAVVVLGNDEPLDATLLPLLSQLGDTVLVSVFVIGHVGLTGGSVDGTDQGVGGDVGQMALVLEPGTGSRDGIGCALTLDLVQNLKARQVTLGEGGERLQQSQTVRGRGHDHINARVGHSGSGQEVGVAFLKAGTGQVRAPRRLELEGPTARGGQGVGHGVEGSATGVGERSDELGRGEEVHSAAVAVVTTREVTVVGCEDGVVLALLHFIGTIPLANAGTAGVGQHDTASLGETVQGLVAVEGSTDLLTTRGDEEVRFGLETGGRGLLDQVLSTGHVLVRGVGAATYETSSEGLRPLLFADSVGELGQGHRKVGSEGSVDVRLQLRQVDSDQLIVLGLAVSPQQVTGTRGSNLCSGLGNVATVSSLQVGDHARREGEEGGGGTNLSTHVTASGHTSTAKCLDTRAVVLNHKASTTADSQLACQVQNDVLWRRPAAKLALKTNTQDAGSLQLPRSIDQRIDSIGTADTDSNGTQTTGVRGVAVGTQHHQTGSGVVLQDALVDNTRTRGPELDAVALGRALQEVKHFTVTLN